MSVFDEIKRGLNESIEYCEEEKIEKKLLIKLHEAEEAVKDGMGWMNLDDLMGVREAVVGISGC